MSAAAQEMMCGNQEMVSAAKVIELAVSEMMCEVCSTDAADTAVNSKQ